MGGLFYTAVCGEEVLHCARGSEEGWVERLKLGYFTGPWQVRVLSMAFSH